MNSPMQNTIILLVEQIVGALGTEFRIYLPQIIPQILRVCMHDSSPGRSVTAKVHIFCNHTKIEYCRSGNICEVLIFKNFARRTNLGIQESRKNYYYNSATEEK